MQVRLRTAPYRWPRSFARYELAALRSSATFCKKLGDLRRWSLHPPSSDGQPKSERALPTRRLRRLLRQAGASRLDMNLAGIVLCQCGASYPAVCIASSRASVAPILPLRRTARSRHQIYSSKQRGMDCRGDCFRRNLSEGKRLWTRCKEQQELHFGQSSRYFSR
jgi:hypothetical protein